MKVVGVCRVTKVEDVEFTEKNTGEIRAMCKCTAFTDDGDALVFYRRAAEEPLKDDIYQLVLTTDKNCKPVIRYQKEK